MDNYEDISAKYVVDNGGDVANGRKLKRNLQPEIAKVDSITKKLVENDPTDEELLRLRTHVAKLLSVIDSKGPY